MKTAWKAALISLASLALLFSGSFAARAGDMDDEEGHKGLGEHQHIDLGIFVGSIQFDDVVDAKNGPIFGVRGAFDWNMHWGAELVTVWSKTNLQSNSHRSKSHDMVALNLIYSFRFDGEQVVVPYVGVGGGVWWEDSGIKPYQEGTGRPPDNTPPPDQNEGMVTGVLGIRFRCTKHIALMLDVREWFVPYYHAFDENGAAQVRDENESAQVHFLYRF